MLPSIGALVEGPSAYGHLSGRANLALIDAAGKSGSRRTRGSRIAATLDRVGLGGIDNRPVKRYSLGMRQRLGLAAALLRTPKLLILDEPTNGLDPQGIREIRDLLIELNAAGTTVFLSSHQLSEVEQLCTRVGIVNRGRLVRQDDLDTLRALTGRSIVHTPDTDRAREVLDGQIERADSGRLVVADADTAALNSRLVAHGVRVTEIAAERRSLEDVVLSVTGSGSDRVDVQERSAAMIRVELAKLVRRPRSWVSLVLLCGLPVLVAVFVAVTHLAPPPGQGPALLSAVLSSGSLYPAAALAIVLPIFLPVAVAVVAGDSIAGEAGLRHPALPAGPAGRPDPAAGRQADRAHRVHAGRRDPGRGDRLPDRDRPVRRAAGGGHARRPDHLQHRGDLAVRQRADPGRHRAAHDRGGRLHRRVHAGRGRDRAVPVHRHRLRRSARPWARWPP